MNRQVRSGRLAAAALLVLLGVCSSLPAVRSSAAPSAAPAAAPLAARVEVPALTGRVVDLTGTLSAPTVAHLDDELAGLEARKGSQVAVLIVPTTRPEEIEQFGIRVAERWRLGRKGVADGAILIVAKNDRSVRIEVGYGLEGALPDAIANRIIGEDITPRFRQGDFNGGVQAGVERMLAVIGGEPLPAPVRRDQVRVPDIGRLLPLLLVIVFVVGGVLRAVLGSVLGSIATGGIIGAIAFLISQLLLVGIGAGIVAFVFALLGGARGGWSSGGLGGGLGGLGGLGGGGGFGGGGFSGGGGGFGGGGASGRW